MVAAGAAAHGTRNRSSYAQAHHSHNRVPWLRIGLCSLAEGDLSGVAGSRKRSNHAIPTTAGLIKASHWSPTDFAFRGYDEPSHLADLRWPDKRAIVELWHFRSGQKPEHLPVPDYPPNRSELFVEPAALTTPAAMSEILAECAAIAGELGAEEIQLPCPSEVEPDADKLDVIDRQFAFAWLRKRL